MNVDFNYNCNKNKRVRNTCVFLDIDKERKLFSIIWNEPKHEELLMLQNGKKKRTYIIKLK